VTPISLEQGLIWLERKPIDLADAPRRYVYTCTVAQVSSIPGLSLIISGASAIVIQWNNGTPKSQSSSDASFPYPISCSLMIG